MSNNTQPTTWTANQLITTLQQLPPETIIIAENHDNYKTADLFTEGYWNTKTQHFHSEQESITRDTQEFHRLSDEDLEENDIHVINTHDKPAFAIG